MTRSAAAILVASLTIVASLAAAHDDVQNHFVKERMHLMKKIAASAKVLADMAEGKTTFDPVAASNAASGLTGNANLILEKFEPDEDDPGSKAKAEIWMNWKDFSSKADGLFRAALTAGVSSPEEVRVSIQAIGASCRACHTTYQD